MFDTDFTDLMHQQFLLAKYGIPLTESNLLADFEREAFVDIAVKHEKLKVDMMNVQPT